MPDFDIDFCFEGRQQVIDYVTGKYGNDRVGQIITFGTLKARAVLRDVARVLDIPYAEADGIAKLVPPELKMTLPKALELEPRLKEIHERGGVHRELIDASLKLEGLARHASTHAAGIVIGRDELTNYVPLYRDPKTGVITTQYDMNVLEECGLVKMDFLGLKTLTLIKNTQALIRKRLPEFDIETVPDDDAPTFRLLGEGKSMCVFQFESSGMQGILKRAKPNSIEDLIALNALYRPGPMAFIDQFIDSKLGKRPIKYPLPELEPILKETYGVIVYQEQVMEIARKVAGYSLGQADILRRAMGKKKAEVMAKEKKTFIEGSVEKEYTKKQAEEIFELLIPFAGYGFNKSHAAAYSVLAYKTAYLKANFPAEFMAANLTNEINSTDKLRDYISETHSMGLEILPPNINLSEKHFTVVDGKVIYGMMGIKNVGASAVDEIIRARLSKGNYRSFLDFLERVDLKTVNRKVIETLIQSGVFDQFPENRATLFTNLEHALDFVSKKKEYEMFGQSSLFDGQEEQAINSFEFEQVQNWQTLELLRFEKENLGFYISGHPLDDFQRTWEKTCNLDTSRLENARSEKMYTLMGLVTSVREIATKNGRRMAFVQIEDFRGNIECIVFSDQWEEFLGLLSVDNVVGLQGKIDTSRGEPKIIVEKVFSPQEMQEIERSELHIRLSDGISDEEELYGLRSFIIEHSGDSEVYLHLNGSAAAKEIIIKASTQIGVSTKESVLAELSSHAAVREVWKE